MVKACLIAAFIASPLWAGEIEINTYRGVMTLEATPETIAVFDIAALDTLEAIGVKPDGVVAPIYVSYLKDAAEGAVPVGSLFDPDFEAVFALQPDLIIAGGRSSGQVPKLSQIAPTIDMTIYEDALVQGLDRLTAFGALFDKQEEAARLRAALDVKLSKARDLARGQGKAMIVLTNGPKVTTYGASGRFGWLHSALDLAEAVSEVEAVTHGEAVSFEFIREANPDVLLVIDRLGAIGTDGSAARSTLDNALVRETNAWKNGKVIYLNPAAIYIAGGGIQSMNLVLDQVIAAFSDG